MFWFPKDMRAHRRGDLKRLLLLTLAVSLWAVPIRAQQAAEFDVYAGPITHKNAAKWAEEGPDAIGGIGDWSLSNGTLCLVIAGLAHEGDFSARGGTLRDIGFCGRQDDQFVSQQDLLEGSLEQPIEITDIQASYGAMAARIVTLGSYRGLMVETSYEVDQRIKDRIRVSKRIWRVDGDAANPSIFSTATLNYSSLQTFLMNTKDLPRSNGFVQEQFVGRSVFDYTKTARPVDTVMMMSPHDMAQPVSYAIRKLSATAHRGNHVQNLPSFALADLSAQAFITMTDPFWFGDGQTLGLAQLLQVPFMGFDEQTELHLEEEIWVAPSADVSALTDRLFATSATVSGRIDSHGQDVRVHIDRAGGVPFTQTTSDRQGHFTARLPQGLYTMRLRTPDGRETRHDFLMRAQDTEIDTIEVTNTARITLPQGNAMRLAFRGIGATRDPHFADYQTGYAVYNEAGPLAVPRVSDVPLAGVASDPKFVYLPEGEYRVYAVRGPEFSVEQARLSVRGATDMTLNIGVPHRVVETPNYMAADLHVHAAPSFDNQFPTDQRVRSFAAEHGEIMVAAEHDTIFDFNPLIRDMGVSDQMIAIIGTEVTSMQKSQRAPHSIGHMNFFPLSVKNLAHKNGLPNHENRRTRDVLDDMRVRFNDPVTQLNHPREDFVLAGVDLPENYRELIDDEAFFEHMGAAGHPFNPHRPITTSPNNSLIEAAPVTGTRDIDFDLLELLNGTQAHRPDRRAAMRQDWFSLLSQGIQLAGSANSDSHNLTQQVSLPRNMVHMPDDTIAGFDMVQFTTALRAGAFYGTTGPQITLALDDAAMGQTHQGETATLRGRIFGADWAMADRLEIQVNGVLVKTFKLPPNGRFGVPLSFSKDSYVTIEAFGPTSETYRAVYPGFAPYAFSNPIYVDADSNGIWSPPGIQPFVDIPAEQ